MRLDFNETNILVQALNDLEKINKKDIDKMELITLLYTLYQCTDNRYKILRTSIKTLISKIESLSDAAIKHIQEDKKNNRIIATVTYKLPDET